MVTFQEFLKKCPFPTFDCKDVVLGKVLGEGANASVYVIEMNDEKYAAKYYHNVDCYDDLEYELDIAQRLKGAEYSVQMKGVGYIQKKSKNDILLLMEFLTSHGDLYDYIQNVAEWTPCYMINNKLIPTPKTKYTYYNEDSNIHWCYGLSESQKVRITRSFIKGVKELHSRKIIHGDIKTNNTVLQYLLKKQKLKLIDFGMSYFTDTDDCIDIEYKCGTLGYRAPEQDNYRMSYSSDIYSLGVTIIELWNGEIWHDGEDFNECRKEVLRYLRRIEKDYPQFGKLLRRSISMNYKKRLTAKTFLEKFNLIFNNDHKCRKHLQN